MDGDLDEVLIVLKDIAKELVWYKEGSAVNAILNSLKDINNRLVVIEVAIKRLEQ